MISPGGSIPSQTGRKTVIKNGVKKGSQERKETERKEKTDA